VLKCKRFAEEFVENVSILRVGSESGAFWRPLRRFLPIDFLPRKNILYGPTQEGNPP
jgi:hypothetical protein